MNARLTALATAALAAAVLAAPANAAAVCLQIVDPTGDGRMQDQLPDDQPGLDIVSADIATGRRNLVAAVRMKASAADAATRPAYFFYFGSGGTDYVLSYVVDATGGAKAGLKTGGDTATTTVDAVYDPGTATVTWTVPRKLIAPLKKGGAKFSGLAARSARSTTVTVPNGRYESTSRNDEAATGRTYTDMTTTCLKGT